MTGTKLLNQIRQFFQNPTNEDAWGMCWELSRMLTWLRFASDVPEEQSSAIAKELYRRLRRSIQQADQEMTPEQVYERTLTVFTELQRRFETLIGDRSLPPEEVLEEIHGLMHEIDALQWLVNEFPDESIHLLSSAVAELSLMERECKKLGETQWGGAEAKVLDSIQSSVSASRELMILHECRFFLDSTRELLPKEALGQTDFAGNPLPEEQTFSELKPFPQSGAFATLGSKELPQVRPEEVETSEPRSSRELCWEAVFHGDVLILTVQSALMRSHSDEEQAQLATTLQLVRERHGKLRDHFRVMCANDDDQARRDWFGPRMQLVIDQIDEQIAEVDQLALDEAVIVLISLRDQVEWLLDQVLELREQRWFPKTHFDKMVNQGYAFRRRLRAELQERKLQERLERTFGKERVSLSENVILSLILVVLALLLLEVSFEFSHGTRMFLMWVDTAICFVFLSEFGVKLALAEGRWLYFRRHFLIDFLPSIPFSFLLWLWNPRVIHVGAAGGRALRLVRVSRMTRYIRFLRPLLRIFRLISFAVRGMDRLLRKYETVFNRNILLLSHPSELSEGKDVSLSFDLKTLRERCRKRLPLLLANVTPKQRLDYISARLRNVELLVRTHGGKHQVLLEDGMFAPGRGELYLESLTNTMLSMDTVYVEESMGHDFTLQMSRVLRYASFPVVRWLPGLRSMSKAYRELDTSAAVAWLIQRVGRGLERIQSWIHWFGDFYGLLTGARVLDRIGLAMINATKRPATRLFLFGFLFLFASLFIQAFGTFQGLAAVIGKYLGAPIIILGCISLIPLLIGFWFRMIAGEATDYFARISEAQFIGRLKDVKWQRSRGDLDQLLERVLLPEYQLRGEAAPEKDELQALFVNQFEQQFLSEASHKSGGMNLLVTTSESIKEWHTRERVQKRILQLYEDYLDGTPLHKSDAKTTNQLLGNITIQNVRKHRLSLPLLEELRIERLDLSRAKLLLYFGPYLWFAAITDNFSLRVAQLIAEFNINCIPLDEQSWMSEEERQQYVEWKHRRQKWLNGEKLPVSRSKKNEKPFRTTAFTALHFVTNDPKQDRAIRDSFGKDIMELMQREREVLVREIFGFYPFHKMTKESRTFNFFHFYQRFASSGRVFLLPLALVWWVLRGAYLALRQVGHLAKDVLRPPSHSELSLKGRAGFDVAIRKINRMRKPVYMEYMRLRAQFDLEYLGLFLSGQQSSGMEGHTFDADLDFIGAMERERDFFVKLRNKRQAQLEEFDALLEELGWDGDNLRTYLGSIAPALEAREGVVLRAITLAYLVDYRSMRTFFQGEARILQLLKDAENPSRWAFLKVWRAKASRLWKTGFFLRKDKEYKLFLAALERFEWEEEALLSKGVWNAYLHARKELRPLIKELAESDSKQHPREDALETLHQVVREHSVWTEEILSLRTLQTLTQLDIRLYRELIFNLGRYEDDAKGRAIFS